MPTHFDRSIDLIFPVNLISATDVRLKCHLKLQRPPRTHGVQMVAVWRKNDQFRGSGMTQIRALRPAAHICKGTSSWVDLDADDATRV